MAASVFDRFLSEGKMPAAFAKFIKKKADGKKPAKADDDDDDCMDESVFDGIVTASGGSRFNLIKEQAGGSAFDQFTGASAFDQFVKPASAQAEAIDDKLAKTSALAESLADLKKKVLGS